jgi:hypothetical protein
MMMFIFLLCVDDLGRYIHHRVSISLIYIKKSSRCVYIFP